ncbi:MAG: hypothetical protein AAGJ82_01920 [Bacteroidota bacterium]
MLDTTCPNCHTSLTGKDADVVNSVINCPNCGHQMPLVDSIVAPGGTSYKDQLQAVDGIALETHNGFHLTIPPKLVRHGKFFLSFGVFTLLFIGMMAYFVGQSDNGAPFIAQLMFALFLGVGCFMVFNGLKRLTGVQYLRIEGQQIHYQQRLFGLLPVRTRTLTEHEVDQFFVKIIQDGSAGERVKWSFTLAATLHRGDPVDLVQGLGRPEYAYYLERQLEQYLGVEDRLVANEFVETEQGDTLQKTREEETLLKVAKLTSESGELTIDSNCTHCGAPLKDGIINEAANLIQCSSCGALEVLHRAHLEKDLAYENKKTAPPQIEGITLTRGLGLELLVHPQTGKIGYFALAFVSIFFIVPLLTWEQFQGITSNTGGWERFAPLLFLLLPTIMVVVLIRSLANYQVIAVKSGQLRTERRLFNRFVSKQRSYQRADIEQLFVIQHEHRSNDGPTTYSYSLNLRQHGQKRPVKLVDSLKTPEAGYYLERKIENFLGITDRPVAEEYIEREIAGMKAPKNFGDLLAMGRNAWRNREK